MKSESPLPPSDFEVEAAAMRLLARTELSVQLLRKKLRNKGFDTDLIDQVLDDLQQRNLLSDERFAEQYFDMRTRKGYGPLRIAAELREKGIHDSLANAVMEQPSSFWRELMDEVLQKKFGTGIGEDYNAVAKQGRFLEYRGFPVSLIRDRLFS